MHCFFCSTQNTLHLGAKRPINISRGNDLRRQTDKLQSQKITHGPPNISKNTKPTKSFAKTHVMKTEFNLLCRVKYE